MNLPYTTILDNHQNSRRIGARDWSSLTVQMLFEYIFCVICDAEWGMPHVDWELDFGDVIEPG